jgi:phage anti-repressor protein
VDKLIPINYSDDKQTVTGRSLHEFLQVESNYTTWFKRMTEYGFGEGTDFIPFWEESTGGRPSEDHQMTIEMAKEICMLQRTERGKLARQYFISLEKAWNSPEAVMARALKMADSKILSLQGSIVVLETENKLLAQQRLEWADRKVIEALVKKYGGKIGYENAWREFKKELLYAHGINLNERITIWRNQHGRKTGPKTLDMIHDEEIPSCISTSVALCKTNDINIDDILRKYNVA